MTTDGHFARRLQQIYADKTESFLRGLSRIPGDPAKVRIRNFGSIRTSIAQGYGWLNRATLTGDEDFDLVNEVIAYFADQRERCLIEWNPGNCFRSGTWDDGLGRHLLDAGFRPGGYRCVWAVETAARSELAEKRIQIRSIPASGLEEYVACLAAMEGQDWAGSEEALERLPYGESDAQWRHYIGRLGDIPCCASSMFIGGSVAYFEWAGTLPSQRNLGCHTAMIRRRLSDAYECGCSAAFAVTDVGVPSARNLQRQGFTLAYNYVMLARPPLPFAGRLS